MIYRIAIQNFENLRDDLIEKVTDAVGSLCKWSFRPFSEGSTVLELVSENVTRPQLEWVTEKLLGLGVQFSVEDLGKDFVHVETKAPVNYDGMGTTELFVTKAEDGKTDLRHVAVEQKQLEWQTARYSSGLFGYRVIT
jgi:hypothetical protein